MLEHPRLELVGLPLDRVAVDVDAPQQHLLGAHDLDVQAGDRQAPLLVDPLAVGLDDLRVEHDHRVVAEVPDEDLLLHADLRGGEGEAVVGGVERAEHLVDEAHRLAVDLVDGRRLGLEHGVAEGADLLGHACQATDGMSHYFDETPGVPSAEATVTVALPDTTFAHAHRPRRVQPRPSRRRHRGAAARGAGAAADRRAARPRLRRRGDRPRRSPAAHRRARCGRSTSTSGRGLCAANAARQRRRQRRRRRARTTCPPTCAST